MTTDYQDPTAVTVATGQIVAQMVAASWEGEIETMIVNVRRALTQPITPAEPEPVELTPAVPIRKSVGQDFIICLEDGKRFKSLKRHLRTHYNLTPEEYRQKWGLPADYPMVAPSYAAVRSKLAKDTGLGRKDR
jgi:predicted transcriptional regulator